MYKVVDYMRIWKQSINGDHLKIYYLQTELQVMI